MNIPRLEDFPNLKNYRTITLSTCGEIFTVVDEETYDDLMQYKWCLYRYKSKLYARRTKRSTDDWRLPSTIYMHRYLAEKYIPKPLVKPKLHCLVDHKKSNGLDNRLSMLAWATPQHNRLNIYGMWWQQKDFIDELTKEA